MEFYISRSEEGGEPEGFDLGDMRLSSGDQGIDSKDDSRLRMMIYLSITSLIDGLVKLKSTKSFEFIGVDSSFALLFKIKGERLSIFYQGRFFAEASYRVFLGVIDREVDRFLAEEGISIVDPVFGDVEASRKKIKSSINTK
ncbi:MULTISPECIES: hypothetical protein [Pseudomonas]|jgi:hypothetical protein|uniref:hypothetical protein n=1 Tax=Pseudomonas TaxID=286 RepID=UPI003CF81AA1